MDVALYCGDTHVYRPGTPIIQDDQGNLGMVWAGTPTPFISVQSPTGFALGEECRETFLGLGLNP